MSSAAAGEVYYADDGTVSTVLDDVYDPNYEPTEQEIEEYAKFLGVDPATEPQLLWLGRAGLKEPMPKEWKPCKTDTGDVYYFNFETGESIWDHPMDEVFKARVETERARLKKEKDNYQPPPEALAAKGKAGVAGKGKKKAMDKVDKKLAEVDAKLASSGAATSFSTPLASLAPVGANKLPLTTNKLNALSAGGPSTLRAADPSLLLPGSTKSPGITTGGIPSAFGGGVGQKLGSALASGASSGTPTATPATGVNAAKETEKRIRERLASDYESKLATIEHNNEKELEEANTDFAAKLKKIEKDLNAQIEDEKDTALRAAERKAKREIQEYEESLDSKREQLRRELRNLREQISEAEVAVSSSARNAEKELEAKKSEIQRQNDAELTRRRLEIHDSWRKEKEAADARAQSELNVIQTNFENEKKSAEAKEKAAFSLKLEEEEAELQSQLQSIKAKLAKQRSDAIADIQANTTGGDSQSPAYIAAQRSYEAAIASAKEAAEESIAAERRAHQKKLADLRAEHEGNMADATAESQSRNSAKAAASLREAQAEADAAIHSLQRELDAELEAELETIRNETKQLEQRAREEASSQLRGAAAEANALVEKARREAATDTENEIARLKAKHQREIAAIEEEIEEAERSKHKMISGVTSTEADALFDMQRKEWLATHPAPLLGPLPTLPPAMQTIYDTGLSDTHKAEVIATVENERGKLMAAADAKLAALQAQMDKDMANDTFEAKRVIESDHKRKVEEYRARLKEELHKENESLRKSLVDDAATSKSASTAARTARKQSKQIEKVLRRKKLRDELESEHRREQALRDAEIARLVAEEQRRLQAALEATTAQLVREQSAFQINASSSSVPLPVLVDSRPATPERQRVSRPPLAPAATTSGYQPHLTQSPVHHQLTFSGLTTEQNTPVRTQSQGYQNPSFENYGQQVPVPQNYSSNVPYITPPSAVPPNPATGTTIGERLAKAREVLRKKKKDLKTRQEQLESARADWRIDMAAAKHNADTAAIDVLMNIKKEMEAVAHKMNEETKDLLEAVAWLKAQEEAEGKRRAAAALYAGRTSMAPATQQQFADPMSTLLGSSGTVGFASASSANINQLLASLAAQTFNMERRMGSLEINQQPQVSQLSDPMSNKWNQWLNQQGAAASVPNSTRPHTAMHFSSRVSPVKAGNAPATRPSSSMLLSSQLHQQQQQHSGPHNPHVDAWLQEQLQM